MIFSENNRSDKEDTKPLHLLIEAKAPLEMIKKFKELGANLSCIDLNGNTPIHVACDTGQLELVQYLVSQGVDGIL